MEFNSYQVLARVDADNLITELTTTGANALTLADGTTSGQVKIITMIVDGGDGTLTPTTFANGSTVTFDAVAESVTLVWNSAIGWVATSSSRRNNSVTIGVWGFGPEI